MKAAVNSIWSDLEDTPKHQVEDVLALVDKRTQDLHEELNKKIDELQVDLQVVKTSLEMWMRSLLEKIADKERPHRRVPLQDINHMVQVRNTAKRS
jgi:2-hydroxy-3-keto-5-methylthiopentenyl-1-phosphate phosphatase